MTRFNLNCLAEALSMIVLSRVVCNATLLTVPSNSVAVIGHRVELKCRTDTENSVIWAFTSFKTSKDINIYFGDNISSPFASRYSIDKSKSGQHDLIIDSVDLDHAGKYHCVEFSTGSKTVAYLTVLDSDPKCSINTSNADERIMDNGYLLMRCSIAYFGDMIPVFSWTNVNTKYALPTDTSNSDNSIIPLIETSSLGLQLNYDDNGVVFKCRLTFQLPNTFQGNEPDFEFTWNYTANVLYGPRNLSISRYEGRLVCSADANPKPKYTWIQIETNTSQDGPDLLFDEAFDANMERVYECKVKNILGTKRRSIAVRNLATTQDSDSYWLIVVASAIGGGSFLLFLLILIIISCFVKRKKRRESTLKRAVSLSRNIDHELNLIDVDLYSYGPDAFRLFDNQGTGSEGITYAAVVKTRNGT